MRGDPEPVEQGAQPERPQALAQQRAEMAIGLGHREGHARPHAVPVHGLGPEAHEPPALLLGGVDQHRGQAVGRTPAVALALEPAAPRQAAERGPRGVGPDAELGEQPHQRCGRDVGPAVEPVVAQQRGQQLRCRHTPRLPVDHGLHDSRSPGPGESVTAKDPIGDKESIKLLNRRAASVTLAIGASSGFGDQAACGRAAHHGRGARRRRARSRPHARGGSSMSTTAPTHPDRGRDTSPRRRRLTVVAVAGGVLRGWTPPAARRQGPRQPGARSGPEQGPLVLPPALHQVGILLL